ncbi:hypothetical protein BN85409930 [Alteracholeplasma palmae J233]|uniref:Uncharacterized protein n=1 Tax=Alteracholeplasma palmae (strain ATCC 49389 / J233) TaxID=1318466 RepID=U4KQG4_ALTPJ|nr:hypothetical protein [Alteracholeplasma palmae]CCV64570.1 hypothetical protein BN85409930 [Alteracholeplasma palmae J233]
MLKILNYNLSKIFNKYTYSIISTSLLVMIGTYFMPHDIAKIVILSINIFIVLNIAFKLYLRKSKMIFIPYSKIKIMLTFILEYLIYISTVIGISVCFYTLNYNKNIETNLTFFEIINIFNKTIFLYSIVISFFYFAESNIKNINKFLKVTVWFLMAVDAGIAFEAMDFYKDNVYNEEIILAYILGCLVLLLNFIFIIIINEKKDLKDGVQAYV